MKKEIAIAFMAAGISSRFGGKIKQFANVGPKGETLIEYSLNQAIKAGFSKIIFIVGNRTEQHFKEKFGKVYKGVPIYYALQKYDEEKRDRPWGTGDALCSAIEFLDCPFVVCNGDDIYGEKSFKRLFNHLKSSLEEGTLGYRLIDVIPDIGSTNRGIFKIKNNYVIDLKEEYNIERTNLLKNKLTPDSYTSMTLFALHKPVIEELKKRLEIFKKENSSDRMIEFLLTNELSKLINSNIIKMRIYPSIDTWYGITNPEDEEKLRVLLQKDQKI